MLVGFPTLEHQLAATKGLPRVELAEPPITGVPLTIETSRRGRLPAERLPNPVYGHAIPLAVGALPSHEEAERTDLCEAPAGLSQILKQGTRLKRLPAPHLPWPGKVPDSLPVYTRCHRNPWQHIPLAHHGHEA
jgi:hypothetical protein